MLKVWFQIIVIKRRLQGLAWWFSCEKLHLPKQGVWVRSLVGELRSHMPRDQKTKT